MATPPQQSDIASFCPQCGGALIESSPLSGDASCGACPWKGKASELLSVPFTHGMGGQNQIAEFFISDFKATIIRPFILPIGTFLVKWGFLDQKDSNFRTNLNRYITVVARGMIRLILEERAAIEKEKANGGT